MAAAQPAPRTIAVGDLLRIEFFLLIAGFIVLISGAIYPGQSISILIMGTIMLVTVALSFLRIAFMNKLLPAVGVSFVTGVLAFIFALDFGVRAKVFNVAAGSMALLLIGGILAGLGAFLEIAKGSLVIRRA